MLGPWVPTMAWKPTRSRLVWLARSSLWSNEGVRGKLSQGGKLVPQLVGVKVGENALFPFGKCSLGV